MIIAAVIGFVCWWLFWLVQLRCWGRKLIIYWFDVDS